VLFYILFRQQATNLHILWQGVPRIVASGATSAHPHRGETILLWHLWQTLQSEERHYDTQNYSLFLSAYVLWLGRAEVIFQYTELFTFLECLWLGQAEVISLLQNYTLYLINLNAHLLWIGKLFRSQKSNFSLQYNKFQLFLTMLCHKLELLEKSATTTYNVQTCTLYSNACGLPFVKGQVV